jgi:serine/threonine protein kinase
MNVVNDKASLLHADQVVHRNIRLSNIVFAEDQSSLIDFDFSGERGVKKYPEGYNCEILDGFRHAYAKENTFLEIIFGPSDEPFSTTEKSEEWSVVCVAVSNGEIETAVQSLYTLYVPIQCADSAMLNQL